MHGQQKECQDVLRVYINKMIVGINWKQLESTYLC